MIRPLVYHLGRSDRPASWYHAVKQARPRRLIGCISRRQCAPLATHSFKDREIDPSTVGEARGKADKYLVGLLNQL